MYHQAPPAINLAYGYEDTNQFGSGSASAFTSVVRLSATRQSSTPQSDQNLPRQHNQTIREIPIKKELEVVKVDEIISEMIKAEVKASRVEWEKDMKKNYVSKSLFEEQTSVDELKASTVRQSSFDEQISSFSSDLGDLISSSKKELSDTFEASKEALEASKKHFSQIEAQHEELVKLLSLIDMDECLKMLTFIAAHQQSVEKNAAQVYNECLLEGFRRQSMYMPCPNPLQMPMPSYGYAEHTNLGPEIARFMSPSPQATIHEHSARSSPLAFGTQPIPAIPFGSFSCTNSPLDRSNGVGPPPLFWNIPPMEQRRAMSLPALPIPLSDRPSLLVTSPTSEYSTTCSSPEFVSNPSPITRPLTQFPLGHVTDSDEEKQTPKNRRKRRNSASQKDNQTTKRAKKVKESKMSGTSETDTTESDGSPWSSPIIQNEESPKPMDVNLKDNVLRWQQGGRKITLKMMK
ncbi:unnamed protein product [Caenorhabditis sp. 36 PRJEB53466]|nr:unnamed protein product [Caenorhabditis sp. 36 PRJEB53466]